MFNDVIVVIAFALCVLVILTAIIMASLYSNSARIRYDDPFEEIFNAFVEKQFSIEKLQIKEIRKNKFILCIFETVGLLQNTSMTYQLILCAKYFNINCEELKENMIKFGAKEKIIQHLWYKYEKVICFSSEKQIQNFLDEYLIPILMVQKLTKR